MINLTQYCKTPILHTTDLFKSGFCTPLIVNTIISPNRKRQIEQYDMQQADRKERAENKRVYNKAVKGVIEDAEKQQKEYEYKMRFGEKIGGQKGKHLLNTPLPLKKNRKCFSIFGDTCILKIQCKIYQSCQSCQDLLQTKASGPSLC